MTAFFDFKKKEKEFVTTLTKHEEVSEKWLDDKKIHGIALNKREAKAIVQLVKEEFLMEGVSIKKVDPDTFEIYAQVEKRTPDYCEDDDWEEDVVGSVRWVFGTYCGKRSCGECPFNVVRDCVPLKVSLFYKE